MRLRDATPEDSEAIRSVHARSIRGLGPAAYSQEQVAAWAAGCESADYAEAIESADTEFLVAVTDAAVVGFGSLTLAVPSGYTAPAEAEITAVYVDPAVAREGVGARLCGALERRAWDAGIRRLGLTASRNAVPFYEAQGYERVTEQEHEFSSSEPTSATGTVVEVLKHL